MKNWICILLFLLPIACAAQVPRRVTLPQSMGAVSLTGQNAAIGSFGSPTTLVTVPATGTYQINLSIYLTAQGTAGTFQLCASYFSVAATKTASCAPNVTTTATLGASGSAVTFQTVSAHALSGTVIGYYVVSSGVTGSPTYGVDMAVTRLQ